MKEWVRGVIVHLYRTHYSNRHQRAGSVEASEDISLEGERLVDVDGENVPLSSESGGVAARAPSILETVGEHEAEETNTGPGGI